MKLVHTVNELKVAISSLFLGKKNEGTIGFVPTMGALHAGHLSLVEQCIKENDISIVSIFVNPTQFNNKEDLEKYPRNLLQDSEYLTQVGVDIVFAPSEKDIYPEPDTRQFDFGQIDKVMEGEHRPGHFNGVAQVVSRLFAIVNPTKAYFGEKDFQQLAIIRAMVRQLDLNIKIVPKAIVREESGLAMSSRNERLTAEQRILASNIFKCLTDSRSHMADRSVAEIKASVVEYVNQVDGLIVEYFDIVDGLTLESVDDWFESDYIVGCIAVFCGEVRLIDNVVYKQKEE